jgi:hypothetical protein
LIQRKNYKYDRFCGLNPKILQRQSTNFEDRAEMECNIDLRYAIPAVISFISVVLSISEDNPWFQLVKFGIASLGYPIFVMVFLFLTILIFVLHFTSINLPLTLQHPFMYLRTRHFSLSWALSLLASLIFPPPIFWLVFPILVIISPWDKRLLSLLLEFYNTLQALPARIILCVPQRDHHQEESEPEPHNHVAIQVTANE